MRCLCSSDPVGQNKGLIIFYHFKFLEIFDALRHNETLQDLSMANTTLGGQINDQTTLNASRLNGGEPFVEDNEILMAFETQKRIIRHLENELQEEKIAAQRKIDEERQEIQRLTVENEQQQKVLLTCFKATLSSLKSN